MSMTFKMLNRTTGQIPSSAGAIVTNNLSGRTTYINSIVLTNTHTAAVTVNLYVVPNSAGSVGTAATANKILNTYSLAVNKTVPINDLIIIMDGTNDTLQADCTVNNVVNIRCFGGVQVIA